jgi:hypothetical protein
VHVASTDALVTKCLEAAPKAFGDAADVKRTDGQKDMEMRRSYQEGSSR